MNALLTSNPRQFILDFFTSFTEEVIHGGEDTGASVDRYYTPDILQISDGIPLDREKLVAHIRPLRKNLVDYRIEVHEALSSGERIAARFTIHAQLRKGGPFSTQVYLFGECAQDGRIRKAYQLTRTLSNAQADQAAAEGSGGQEELA